MIKSLSLEGQRILYVAPNFFGYDEEIGDEMRRRGAEVVRLFDRPFDTPLMTAVTKISPDVVSRAALAHYYKTIEDEKEAFDIVFVINGQTLHADFLERIRHHSPRATYILYLWDALRNRKSVIPKLSKFDYVFSFDRGDTLEYGLAYRPLFFSPIFATRCDEPIVHEISFVGTAHSDRAPVVQAIDQMLPKGVARFWYLFLKAPWVRTLYSCGSAAFRRVPQHMFYFDPLPKEIISRVFRQSRIILDIEHPRQRGLTMRSFEALGAGKKLITTNRHIVEEEFYHPQNILVIDRKNISIDRDFLEHTAKPVPDDVRRRYTLAGWLDEVLMVLN